MDGQVGRPVPREHADPAGAEVEALPVPGERVLGDGVSVDGTLQDAILSRRDHRYVGDGHHFRRIYKGRHSVTLGTFSVLSIVLRNTVTSKQQTRIHTDTYQRCQCQ